MCLDLRSRQTDLHKPSSNLPDRHKQNNQNSDYLTIWIADQFDLLDQLTPTQLQVIAGKADFFGDCILTPAHLTWFPMLIARQSTTHSDQPNGRLDELGTSFARDDADHYDGTERT